MPNTLTFDHLCTEQRLPAWKDAVCDTFVKLECETDPQLPFHGKLEAAVFDDLHVSRVQSSPQVVRRTRSLAEQADQAFVLLSVQTRGKTIVRQGDSEAILTPGSLAFYDTARPYSLILPHNFDQIVLHLPRGLIEQSCPGGLEHMAQRVHASNPFAQAICALAPQLLRLANDVPSHLAHRTAAAAIEMISLALSSLVSATQASAGVVVTQEPKRSNSADALLWRTRELISEQIDDTSLSPSLLAAQTKVSLRRLQEAFKSQGTTPSDCIWEMRLEFVRGLLASTLHREASITTLAYRAGFSDMAHFSRRFKQQFGMTPSQYRSAH
jgi:AraC-like DNA-binding protein